MPSQAGNSPAKSKRNSSYQTGDLSYPDHTGEYWLQLLSRLPVSEGLRGVPAGPQLLPGHIASFCPHQISGARGKKCGPFLVLKSDTEFSFHPLKSLGNCYKAVDLFCCVRHDPFVLCIYFYFVCVSAHACVWCGGLCLEARGGFVVFLALHLIF